MIKSQLFAVLQGGCVAGLTALHHSTRMSAWRLPASSIQFLPPAPAGSTWQKTRIMKEVMQGFIGIFSQNYGESHNMDMHEYPSIF
ncbi:hypothetical protein Mfla_1101 [Methylobacillus flagellatus KT]|uniref:Uncharacterized protein n=1 Tax=Methylobacillus flagellatus (strain ATCC 51484 / DSM 6875 / VKM B-1610 / KT) TaxID=265072 RepID=Q1H2B8_METFK|nr:hypothetical protein Mfla_0957 [Methylobacillus flagellatus KT]ABE49369.1 hypothetical protein Mfla_1101 [Methylobacillus flagellatus KT]